MDNERCHRLALYQPQNPNLEPAPSEDAEQAADGICAAQPSSPALEPDDRSPCSNVLFTHIISQSDIVRYAALLLARVMGQPSDLVHYGVLTRGRGLRCLFFVLPYSVIQISWYIVHSSMWYDSRKSPMDFWHTNDHDGAVVSTADALRRTTLPGVPWRYTSIKVLGQMTSPRLHNGVPLHPGVAAF